MILMEITDKRESTNSIHIKSYYKSNYYFIMDDGTKFEVSESVYDKYSIGDDIFINRYDEYSLDKKGNRILVDSTYEWKGK